jgi:hypothetical protein
MTGLAHLGGSGLFFVVGSGMWGWLGDIEVTVAFRQRGPGGNLVENTMS